MKKVYSYGLFCDDRLWKVIDHIVTEEYSVYGRLSSEVDDRYTFVVKHFGTISARVAQIEEKFVSDDDKFSGSECAVERYEARKALKEAIKEVLVFAEGDLYDKLSDLNKML